MPRRNVISYTTYQVRAKIKRGQKREKILGEASRAVLKKNFIHKKGDPNYFICAIFMKDGIATKVEGTEEPI